MLYRFFDFLIFIKNIILLDIFYNALYDVCYGKIEPIKKHKH